MINFNNGKFNLDLNKNKINKVISLLNSFIVEKYLVLFSLFFAVSATIYSFYNHYILAYGDAESHVNIAKRVVGALTPGFAQLGGIWEPLPHIMMLPLVWNDFLWRTGLAGSIVFGACFVIASIFLYKMILLLTENKYAAFIGFLIFTLNPNLLYLQSTPMTEIPFITFSIISSYYFIKFLFEKDALISLILSALFALFASLCRYDGWFLILFESLAIIIFEILKKKKISAVIDQLILFGTLAFFGIILWFGWNWIILGDPLYFNNSVYSAKSQQMSWYIRHELPAYKNLWVSFVYYFVDSFTNTGFFTYMVGVVGLLYFLIKELKYKHYLIALVLLSPFIFNILTLYMGQSIIFLPSITPKTFQWTLFNVRYGVLMIPATAVFFAYLFAKSKIKMKILLLCIFCLQTLLFVTGFVKTIALEDGITGLSTAKIPWDAENFINKHYDGGFLLEDDFARSMSITHSTIPMNEIIYIGTKPYYQISLIQPERYARWIIMQKDDEIWKGIYENKTIRGRLYKYFKKVYTSDRILIFKKI